LGDKSSLFPLPSRKEDEEKKLRGKGPEIIDGVFGFGLPGLNWKGRNHGENTNEISAIMGHGEKLSTRKRN